VEYLKIQGNLVLFGTVYFQGQEEMPTDKCNGLLALQRINGVDISYRNLSWDTISEVQECLAQISKRQIVDRINESEFYAIMIDESSFFQLS
jgi:hypothetical protein